MRLSARIICIEACSMLFAATCGEALAGGFGIKQSAYSGAGLQFPWH
jgi:hypothetical protein